VTGSKDTDGLTPAYEYEAWGDLKKITPPGGEAATSFTYNPATSTANATVTMTTADASTTYNTVTYEYDKLGRLSKTQRSLPGVACAEQVVGYDNLGRRATESVWKNC